MNQDHFFFSHIINKIIKLDTYIHTYTYKKIYINIYTVETIEAKDSLQLPN